jgi:hypothetical protein
MCPGLTEKLTAMFRHVRVAVVAVTIRYYEESRTEMPGFLFVWTALGVFRG